MDKEEKEKLDLEKENESVKIKRFLDIALWAMLIFWMAICLIDFYNTKVGNEPMFCLKNDVNKYSDGDVDICTGFGYKVINYKRDSYKGMEYGMFFFTKDRTADNK